MRIQRLKLRKLNNTRDIGGFEVKGGKKIVSGKLIRSGKPFKLPKSTCNKLLALGLTDIIDLRSDRERAENPATPIEGVKVHILPLMCTATTGMKYKRSMAGVMLEESRRIESEFGTADNYMKSMYETILFSDSSRPVLKKFFEILTQAEGCVMWHCNGGKDRTGLVAMLTEGLLGADEATVIGDYTASDKFGKRLRNAQKFGLKISPLSKNFKAILYSLMDAKPQYIIGALDEIKARYGNIENYCKQALELSDMQISIIKNKYTV